MSNRLIYQDGYVQLFLEMEGPCVPLIHCHVLEWNLKTYKICLETWSEILEEFKGRGVSKIYAAAPNDEVLKFASMFGFSLIGTATTARDEEVDLMEIKL